MADRSETERKSHERNTTQARPQRFTRDRRSPAREELHQGTATQGLQGLPSQDECLGQCCGPPDGGTEQAAPRGNHDSEEADDGHRVVHHHE